MGKTYFFKEHLLPNLKRPLFCDSVYSFVNSESLPEYISLQSLEVRNHWEIWAQFPPHEILLLFYRQAFLRMKSLRKWPYLLYAENEEELVNGILELKLPSQSAGRIHWAHQRFEFEKLDWRQGVRPVSTGLARRVVHGNRWVEMHHIGVTMNFCLPQQCPSPSGCSKTRKFLPQLGRKECLIF